MHEAGRSSAVLIASVERARNRCAFGLLGAASAHAQATPIEVLVFHGPSDPTTDAGVAAIEALGTANDFEVDATADAAEFTPTNLADYRAVVFLNTAGDRLNDCAGVRRRAVRRGRRRLPRHRHGRGGRARHRRSSTA